MHFEPRFDRIIIDSPTLPLENGIKTLKLREYKRNQLRKLIKKTPIIYTKYAKGTNLNIRFDPIITRSYIRTKTKALLSLKAGQLSAKEIEEIALTTFGSLQNLTISYIETRIDLFNVTFKEIFTQLAIIGKHSIDYRFVGETIYFGKPSTGHQVVLYDKGLECNNQENNHIRVEARLRLEKKDRPLLEDFLTGIWRPEKPFRESYLVNTQSLPLKREEKISLSKIGLTRFYMGLTNNRKTTLRKHMKNNIRLDFNTIFAEWLASWIETDIQSKDITVDYRQETKPVKPLGDLCHRLITIHRANQYRLKTKALPMSRE